jgi:hypothetical protein
LPPLCYPGLAPYLGRSLLTARFFCVFCIAAVGDGPEPVERNRVAAAGVYV